MRSFHRLSPALLNDRQLNGRIATAATQSRSNGTRKIQRKSGQKGSLALDEIERRWRPHNTTGDDSIPLLLPFVGTVGANDLAFWRARRLSSRTQKRIHCKTNKRDRNFHRNTQMKNQDRWKEAARRSVQGIVTAMLFYGRKKRALLTRLFRIYRESSCSYLFFSFAP